MSKLDSKKWLVCCANGAGSSLMMKMALEKLLNRLNITPDSIYHCALNEGKEIAANYDIVFCAKNFAAAFADAEAQGVIVLGLKNIMSDKEMERQLSERGLLD